MPGEFIQRFERPQGITLLNLEPELSFCPVSCWSRRKVQKTPLQTFKLFILHLVAYQKQMVRLHYKTQHILCFHNTEIKLEQNQKLLTCRLDSECPKMLCRLQGEKSYQPFYLALDPVSYTISQPRKKQAHWCNVKIQVKILWLEKSQTLVGNYYSYLDKWAWFSYQIAFYISVFMFTEWCCFYLQPEKFLFTAGSRMQKNKRLLNVQVKGEYSKLKEYCRRGGRKILTVRERLERGGMLSSRPDTTIYLWNAQHL